eukprot:3816712-Lingulodinium_polyedra.AAC.1
MPADELGMRLFMALSGEAADEVEDYEAEDFGFDGGYENLLDIMSVFEQEEILGRAHYLSNFERIRRSQ